MCQFILRGLQVVALQKITTKGQITVKAELKPQHFTWYELSGHSVGYCRKECLAGN